MQKQLEALKNTMAEIVDLRRSAAVLAWDQETYMPPGGAQARAEQLATLSKIAHEKFTSDEFGLILDALQSYAASLDSDSDEAALLRVIKQDYSRAKKLPAQLVARFSRSTSLAINTWKQARAQNNFSLLQPHLEEIIDLTGQKAEAWGYKEHIYDALLEEYEPGMKSSQVGLVFSKVKAALVPLIQAIIEQADRVDDSVLHQEYDIQKQWDFGVQVIKACGYNFEHGRQDKSAHPFTISFDSHDVRITTRFLNDYFSTGLFGTLHEAGHGLYEQGFAEKYRRTGLDEAASLGIHESQSRMWENIIGRGQSFWTYYFPRLKQTFPHQLENVSTDAFYRAINKVKPSLIRVEADEVTYNMHIFLRFELERELLTGAVKVADLPQAWNERMKSYLGVTPNTNSNGVMQDIHWPSGLFGYFPTYALGNVISGQFFSRLVQDHPNVYDQIARGQFSQILSWLRENIHSHGRKYTPAELIERVCNQPLNADPYITYITNKYRHIYEL